MWKPGNVVGGSGTVSGGTKTKVGTSFKNMVSGKPNAPIKPPKVERPSRPDYGSPVGAPTISNPDRKNYGTPSTAGIAQTAYDAKKAMAGFNDPRSTDAFKSLMGLATEQTAVQAGERSRNARNAASRRGYAGGFEDEGREADQDRMQALAMSGFAGAESVRAGQADVYGKSIGAFTQLQTSYNEAKLAGDIAFARDLTQTHMANAENTLKTAGLNMEQQLSFAQGLNEAKMLQAKLDQDFNNSLIDNNRYIEAQQQIGAQLLAQEMALAQRDKEFKAEDAFRNKQLSDERERFELGLKANPGTALRTFQDPRYGGPKGRRDTPRPGSVFTGLD